MNMDYLLPIYGFGYLIFAIAIMDAKGLREHPTLGILACAVLAIIWPIALPANILRKLLR